MRFEPCDVADEAAVKRAIANVARWGGRLDIVINNAADFTAFGKPVEKLQLAQWRRTLDVNLGAAFLFAKHAARHLRKRRGCIVNITSTRACMSESNTEAYAASKGGLSALTHALAISLGPEIRVNAVAPAWIAGAYGPCVRGPSGARCDVPRLGSQGTIADVMQADDLGRYPNWALLTGAGFTANWGGLLARDVWAHVFSNALIQSTPPLVEFLLGHALGNFELALHLVRQGSMSDEDRDAVERAVVEVFDEQQRRINASRQRPCVNEHGVRELLSLFGSGRKDRGNMFDGIDSGYIFTLNVDLLFESLAMEEMLAFEPIVFPGVPLDPQVTPGSPSPAVRALPTVSSPVFRGSLNCIKLHGSYNWRSGRDKRVLVVGGAKSAQINEFDLLRRYLEIFERVLNKGSLRLMVIGYGFGDDHINGIIARAVRDSGLRLFVIDVRDARALRDGLVSKEHGDIIFKAITGFSHSPLTATFEPPFGDHQTVECKAILRNFFGDDFARTLHR